jgi:hypothetical protein
MLALSAELYSVQGKEVIIWTDNTTVYWGINKCKPQTDTLILLRSLVQLSWQFNFRLRAAYIPTQLNMTADGLSRMRGAAQGGNFTIRPSIFQQVTAGLITKVAFADITGKSARVLLSPAHQVGMFYFSVNNPPFINAYRLANEAIWFNPPHALAGTALKFFAQLLTNFPHTWCMGLIPVWPEREWYKKYILRNNPIFRVMCVYPPGTQLFIKSGTAKFRNYPTHRLSAYPE